MDAGNPAAIAGLEERLERLRIQPEPELFGLVRRGWCLGEDRFRESMLARVAAAAGDHHHGEELAAAAAAKADILVARELARLGWTETDLRTHAKGDARKLALAHRLRAESTMTLQWIADRLVMGTAGHLSHLLYWSRRGMRPPKPARASQGRAGQGTAPVPRGRRPAVRVETPDMPGAGAKEPTMAGSPPPAAVPEETGPFVFDTAFD
jgi:hypothetical protein